MVETLMHWRDSWKHLVIRMFEKDRSIYDSDRKICRFKGEKKKKAKQKLLSEDQNIRKYKAFIFMQKWAVIRLVKRLSKRKAPRLTTLQGWNPITHCSQQNVIISLKINHRKKLIIVYWRKRLSWPGRSLIVRTSNQTHQLLLLTEIIVISI